MAGYATTSSDVAVAARSDLFGLEPIWRVWLELICISYRSGDLIGGVE